MHTVCMMHHADRARTPRSDGLTGATTRLFDPNTRKPSTFTFDHSYWSHDGYVADENGYLRPADDEYADQQKVYDDLGNPAHTIQTTRAALRERAQRGESWRPPGREADARKYVGRVQLLPLRIRSDGIG